MANKLDGTTHWEVCATEGGRHHYDCAVARIRELEAIKAEYAAKGWHIDAEQQRTDECKVRIGKLEAALERSLLAIDDWLHLFAPELCNADDVARSRSRVMAVGTLAYIADVQQQNRAALTPAETKGEQG